MSKSFPELSVDTQLLFDRLIKAKIGETVTYQELSGLIGADVQGRARGLLRTARKKAMREERMVFGVVRNVGLKRLDDSGIVSTGQLTLAKIRRQARMGMVQLACVRNFDAMPNEAKVAHNTHMSMLGALVAATKPTKVKALESKIAAAGDKLPVGRTIAALVGE